MLVQKVKVTAVGDPVAYQKKENNTPLKTPDGQDVVGYRRQVLFESVRMWLAIADRYCSRVVTTRRIPYPLPCSATHASPPSLWAWRATFSSSAKFASRRKMMASHASMPRLS